MVAWPHACPYLQARGSQMGAAAHPNARCPILQTWKTPHVVPSGDVQKQHQKLLHCSSPENLPFAPSKSARLKQPRLGVVLAALEARQVIDVFRLASNHWPEPKNPAAHELVYAAARTNITRTTSNPHQKGASPCQTICDMTPEGYPTLVDGPQFNKKHQEAEESKTVAAPRFENLRREHSSPGRPSCSQRGRHLQSPQGSISQLGCHGDKWTHDT